MSVSIGRKVPVKSAKNEAMKAAYHALSELGEFYWFQSPSNTVKYHETHNIKRDLGQHIVWQ